MINPGTKATVKMVNQIIYEIFYSVYFERYQYLIITFLDLLKGAVVVSALFATMCGVNFHRSLFSLIELIPIPTYPLSFILKPIPAYLSPPTKSARRIHVSLAESYSQKSLRSLPLNPVPTYALEPITKATDSSRELPPKSAFLIQLFVCWSYSQKSFLKSNSAIFLSVPIPT